MTRKIKNHLIWIVRCYRVMTRVIQKKIVKFLTLVVANYVDILIISTGSSTGGSGSGSTSSCCSISKILI